MYRSAEIKAAESGGLVDSNFLGLMDLWVPFCFPLLSGFVTSTEVFFFFFFFLRQDLMYIVGSIYIKRKPIIVLIEQDLGHEMGFGFEDLISKIVRDKSFFNMLLLILFLLWLI